MICTSVVDKVPQVQPEDLVTYFKACNMELLSPSTGDGSTCAFQRVYFVSLACTRVGTLVIQICNQAQVRPWEFGEEKGLGQQVQKRALGSLSGKLLNRFWLFVNGRFGRESTELVVVCWPTGSVANTL